MLKDLEFLLVDMPAHPGETFPRTSGMRFRYSPSRPIFDAVTAIEIGDMDRGYRAIDITGKDQQLYSVSSPLYFAKIAMAIPKYTKGKLPLVPKTRRASLSSPGSRHSTTLATILPTCCRLTAAVDKGSVATGSGNNALREIKEWQAIMDHLRNLPVKSKGELPTIAVDERAKEVRAIKVG
jgi:5'-nucleotidase/UDP-sugar diphosphatase